MTQQLAFELCFTTSSFEPDQLVDLGTGSPGTTTFFFLEIFRTSFKIFRFWLGGAAPQTHRLWARGTPPLNGRSSHLIEAAKRGRLDQMIFFRRRRAADDTRAADDRATTARRGL